jgi:hypothetical protein
LTLLAIPASAHDSLIDSEPGPGEVLTQIPDDIVLHYSGEISELGVQLVVTGPEGRDVVQGTPDVQGTAVTQNLAEELADGDYEAVWRVTSADGHPISGTLSFTIAAAATADHDEPTAVDPGVGTQDAVATTDAATESAATETASSPELDRAAVTAGPRALGTDADAVTSGMPAWGWLVAALAALGLVACGVLAFRRN